MALGARNRTKAANRPKPQPTSLEKLKKELLKQYISGKPMEPSPAPAPGPEKR